MRSHKIILIAVIAGFLLPFVFPLEIKIPWILRMMGGSGLLTIIAMILMQQWISYRTKNRHLSMGCL